MILNQINLLLKVMLTGFLSVAIIFFFTPFAVAHDVTPHPHAEDSQVGNTKHKDPDHGSLGNVGAKLANPLADLWSMSMNFEFLKFYDGDINTGDANVGSDLILQPVMPIPLFGEGDAEWMLITRPVIPIVLSQPVPRGFNEFYNKAGIGDIQFPAMLAVPGKYAGKWILGAGPIAMFPTATSDELGSDQFGLGPAVVFGKSKLDEFKEEIVALLRNGSSKKFVADRYGTSQVNLYNWIKKNNIDVKQQNICV